MPVTQSWVPSNTPEFPPQIWTTTCASILALSQRCSFNSNLVLFASLKICWKVLFFHWKQAKSALFQWSIAMIHVQIWTQAEKWIRNLLFMGPRKAKQEVKFNKPTFYCIVYTTYKLHQLILVAPQKSGVPRPIEHSETVIACMSKQILAPFQLKKLKKGDIHQKTQKGGFSKKGQEGRKKGEHLWERATQFNHTLLNIHT